MMDSDTVRFIRELCEIARDRDLPVSFCVQTITRSWRRSPRVQQLPAEQARSLLVGMVDACLEAYYGDRVVQAPSVAARSTGGRA
jgi:hypothetical protein